jgi:hypothetical protein
MLAHLDIEDDVVHGKNTHDLPEVIKHRQPPHSTFAHLPEGGMDIVIWLAGVDVPVHDVSHREFAGKTVPRRQGDEQIPVRYDADHFVLYVHNGQNPTILIPHDLSSFAQIRLGAAANRRTYHDVSDFHDIAPFFSHFLTTGRWVGE